MPDWKPEIRKRLASLRLVPTREVAIVEELAQHLDDCYAEWLTGGVTEEGAYRAALAELSESEILARELRRVERQVAPEPIVLGTNRRTNMIADLWQDLRYGVRMLMKQKGITAIAVLSLALGIGANTALFSIVDAMLLKLLPVKEPERLVLFQAVASREFNVGGYSGNTRQDPVTGQTRMTSFAQVSYQRMREQGQQPSGAFSDIFAFSNVGLNVSADGQADRASGLFATGNYYRGLGVQPLLGRVLTEEDDQLSATPVAVLSYRYWQNRFSGDAGVVGKQINLNNRAFTIIGVTPPGFDGTGQVGDTRDITIPLAHEAALNADPKDSRNYGAGLWWLRVMGRLQPGATMAQARRNSKTLSGYR